MNLKTAQTLRNNADYEAALKAVRPFFDNEPEPGTASAVSFDALTLLITDYERRHFSMGPLL